MNADNTYTNATQQDRLYNSDMSMLKGTGEKDLFIKNTPGQINSSGFNQPVRKLNFGGGGGYGNKEDQELEVMEYDHEQLQGAGIA